MSYIDFWPDENAPNYLAQLRDIFIASLEWRGENAHVLFEGLPKWLHCLEKFSPVDPDIVRTMYYQVCYGAEPSHKRLSREIGDF